MAPALSLWWFPLRASEAQQAAWRDWLDSHERARAARYLHPGHGARYIAAHAHLRHALAQAMGCAPADVIFARGEHGKPFVAAGPRFNLSHSGELGLLALHPDLELGVDIEVFDRARDWLALARRFYTPSESAWLAAQPPAELPRAFCRLWTVKEAWMKALGRGLAAGPANLEVSLLAPPLAVEPASARRWWARELAVPGHADCAAAVVCPEAPVAEPTLRRLAPPG